MKKLLMSAILLILCVFVLVGCGNIGQPSKDCIHDFEDGKCTHCGKVLKTTDGLEFEPINDGTEYSLYGIGNSTTSDIVVPSEYKGKPVTKISSFAFQGNKSITSVLLPDSITEIGIKAFENCTNLKSINIDENILSIGAGAFVNCAELEGVIFKRFYEDIQNIFAGCTKLNITERGFTYIANFLLKCDTALTSAKIKDGTIGIEACAFQGCSNLASITISDSVISIGNSAFSGCSNLSSITIGNGVTKIGDSSFSNCSHLTNINIPDSVISIGNSAFSRCSRLTSITIGNGVTSIGKDAFYNCSSLTEVHITDIAAWCNIKFALTMSDYWSYEVNSCSNPLYYARNLYLNNVLLENLIIPNGVTSISGYAFYNCSNLASVTIPDSIRSIGTNAFYNCSSLTSIYFNGTVADWNAINKYDNWNYNTGDYIIYCKNGYISKSYMENF